MSQRDILKRANLFAHDTYIGARDKGESRFSAACIAARIWYTVVTARVKG